MRWLRAVMAIGLSGAATAAAGGQRVGLAATPPMGWNSWDAYGLTITEPAFRANVTVQKEKLLSHGWNYSVIDEGWFFENPQDRDKPDTLRYAIDSHGRYVPVPARFPSAAPAGMRAAMQSEASGDVKLSATIEETSFVGLAAWVHAQGLKFGIHIVRGIPRASTERNLPIEGSAFHAVDAADQSEACPWDPTNWGVKDNAAGQAWYDSLLRQYATWGIDFLKVDCIASRPYKADEIRMIRRAIDKTGRTILLSLSPGPTDLANAGEVNALSNMWRIADDEWDLWDSQGKAFPQGTKDQFARLNAWNKYAKPGTWPDADMLPIGELRPSPGWGAARTSRLTAEEVRTELTLWSIARSPMILGANLTLLDDTTLGLLTNPLMVATNQTATESGELVHEGALVVWRAKLPGERVALAVFNTGDSALRVDRTFRSLDPKLGKESRATVDVWAGRALGKRSAVAETIPPHGCVFWMLTF